MRITFEVSQKDFTETKLKSKVSSMSVASLPKIESILYVNLFILIRLSLKNE